MKHIKRTAVIFLVAALLLSSLLAGCAAPKSEYELSVVESAAKAAAKERVKTEISNNYKTTFKIAKEADDLVLESVENDDLDWSVSGKVTVTSKSDAADVQTVDFSISLHLIDYVGQPTPTFKLTEFTMGEIVVPEK